MFNRKHVCAMLRVPWLKYVTTVTIYNTIALCHYSTCHECFMVLVQSICHDGIMSLQYMPWAHYITISCYFSIFIFSVAVVRTPWTFSMTLTACCKDLLMSLTPCLNLKSLKGDQVTTMLELGIPKPASQAWIREPWGCKLAAKLECGIPQASGQSRIWDPWTWMPSMNLGTLF